MHGLSLQELPRFIVNSRNLCSIFSTAFVQNAGVKLFGVFYSLVFNVIYVHRLLILYLKTWGTALPELRLLGNKTDTV